MAEEIKKFLDYEGLTTYDEKIKAFFDTQMQNSFPIKVIEDVVTLKELYTFEDGYYMLSKPTPYFSLEEFGLEYPFIGVQFVGLIKTSHPMLNYFVVQYYDTGMMFSFCQKDGQIVAMSKPRGIDGFSLLQAGQLGFGQSGAEGKYLKNTGVGTAEWAQAEDKIAREHCKIINYPEGELTFINSVQSYPYQQDWWAIDFPSVKITLSQQDIKNFVNINTGIEFKLNGHLYKMSRDKSYAGLFWDDELINGYTMSLELCYIENLTYAITIYIDVEPTSGTVFQLTDLKLINEAQSYQALMSGLDLINVDPLSCGMAIGDSQNSAFGSNSLAFGHNNTAKSDYSCAFGSHNKANAEGALALGLVNTVSGQYSCAIGYLNQATGVYSQSTGERSQAIGDWSFANGYMAIAGGRGTRAMGIDSQAFGASSWVSGFHTKALADEAYSHGLSTLAEGNYSAALGTNAMAYGLASYAQGYYTVATRANQYAIGRYNILDANEEDLSTQNQHFIVGDGTTKTFTIPNVAKVTTITRIDKVNPDNTKTTVDSTTYTVQNNSITFNSAPKAYQHYKIIFTGYGSNSKGDLMIVGNGTAENSRSNAYVLDRRGNAWFAGDVFVGSTSGTNKDAGSVKLIKESDIGTIDEWDAYDL